MKAKKHIKQYLLLAFIAAFAVSCFDNVPPEGVLPTPNVAFTYRVIDENYQIDFYVYATVQFTNTSLLRGTAHWDFGDGTTATGNVVTHNFQEAGLYNVTLTVAGESKTLPILIKEIVPMMRLLPSDHPDGIIEVLNTPVIIEAHVPQPVPDMVVIKTWSFPPGTRNPAGEEVRTFVGDNPFADGGFTFSTVGSQQVSVSVDLSVDGDTFRRLQEASVNIQVALDVPAPTLYIAVRNQNILALKIPAVPNPHITIYPFDLGINSGATPFNILFHEPTDELFILDAGVRFTFLTLVTDINTAGDGDIRVMSADGSRVETMITNRGWHHNNDPYFGFIRGNHLYYSNRNTGVMRIPLNTRNVITSYNTLNAPWFFANHLTGWFGRGISYGAINSAFLQIDDVWWWGKTTFNANGGIFRFRESDIFRVLGQVPAPEAGAVLPGVSIRALLWDDINEVLYFTTIGASATSGVFRAAPAELETITSIAGLEPFRLTTVANPDLGVLAGQNMSIRATPSEGSAYNELIGIPQLALDRATGNVYFGFRSGNPNLNSGLMRVNASLPGNEVIEYVIYDMEGITGVAINNKPTRLF